MVGAEWAAGFVQMLLKTPSAASPVAVVGAKWAAGVAGDASGDHLLQVLRPLWVPNGPQELQEILAEAICC